MGWVAMLSQRPTQLENHPQGHSLGHLGDVFVAQGDPQVVVLVQENLLNPGFPDAARLIPGKRAGSVTAGTGLGDTWSPCCQGGCAALGGCGEMGGHRGSSWLLFQVGFASCLQLLNGGKG